MDKNELFVFFCKHGNLDKAQELLEKNPTIDLSFNSYSAFLYSCFYGHLLVAQWLYSLLLFESSTSLISLHKNDNFILFLNYSFGAACSRGHLDVAQWLFSVWPSLNVSDENEYAFRYACCLGKLRVAKWLLTIKPTINISALDDFAFVESCINGHLTSAQWLLTVKPTINISQHNEYAFIHACENGHFELVTWLFSIKPTINLSANNDEAFRYSCENEHLEIAQWLQSLLPDIYDVFIENNKIVTFNIKRILHFHEKSVSMKYTNFEELVCPICYEKCIEVETNCEHNFCEACIANYYNKNNSDNNCLCPYCRQVITSFHKIVFT